MAVLRQAEAARVVSQAVVLDLGDLKRQAEEMKSRALAEATRIVQEAHKERAKLISDAREVGKAEGFEQGRKDGQAKGLEEGRQMGLAERKAGLAQLETAWISGLDSFLTRREEMLHLAKTDVLKLAAEIARRVVKRVVELDPKVVEGQIEAALRETSRATKLIVAVSAADEPLAREALAGAIARLGSSASAELVVDAALSAGSCVVRSGGGGEVNAEVLTQLDRVIETLLPKEATP
ncbi:MAG: FliH/SctL family protein [Phycisphaerales bacterium]|jgi:flagellar assembly protein FliH